MLSLVKYSSLKCRKSFAAEFLRFAAFVLLLIIAFADFSSLAEAAQTPTASKASGEVVFYATAPQNLLDAASKKFNETHPGIKLRSIYSRGPELAQKIEAEVAANKIVASLIMVPQPVILYDWRKRGMLMQYSSPEEKAYDDWFKEPGWWIGWRVLDVPLTFNTRLVQEARVFQ